MGYPLIAGHKYLFKHPEGWQAHQIWSEFIAYHLSILCGVPVPQAFIAQDGDGRFGVLVEFFYGHPRSPYRERFVSGADLLQRFLIDKKRGRPHTVRTNLALSRAYRVPEAAEKWGKMLVFDALIGNQDRHPSNWGFVWRYQSGGSALIDLAPAYDNATSMAYSVKQENIENMLVPDRISRYIRPVA